MPPTKPSGAPSANSPKVGPLALGPLHLPPPRRMTVTKKLLRWWLSSQCPIVLLMGLAFSKSLLKWIGITFYLGEAKVVCLLLNPCILLLGVSISSICHFTSPIVVGLTYSIHWPFLRSLMSLALMKGIINLTLLSLRLSGILITFLCVECL